MRHPPRVRTETRDPARTLPSAADIRRRNARSRPERGAMKRRPSRRAAHALAPPDRRTGATDRGLQPFFYRKEQLFRPIALWRMSAVFQLEQTAVTHAACYPI